MNGLLLLLLLFFSGSDNVHKIVGHFLCRNSIFWLQQIEVLRLGIQRGSYQCRQNGLRMYLMPGELQGIIQSLFKREACLQQRIDVVIVAIQAPDGNREKFHTQRVLRINRFEIVVRKTGVQGRNTVLRRKKRQLHMVAHIELYMLRS